MSGADRDLPLVILGAGLAGLSLGCALIEAGVRRPIVLLERRREWTRDRTWCTWDVRAGGAGRFTELADHRWPAWRVAGQSGAAVMRSPGTPYLHLRGDAVYRCALDRLAAAPEVLLCTGERVRAIRDEGPDRPPTVVTDRRELAAAHVFDARGRPIAGAGDPKAAGVALEQRFLGWEVEVGRPVFDPGLATLMEFRGGGPGDLRFLYVLPFTPRRALIEDTSFGSVAVPPAQRRAALERDLSERFGVADPTILHEERGRVPMTTRRFALHPSPHVHAVGTAGGAVRPSSGYAFSRIQAHCTAVAAAVASGRPLPVRLGPRRRALLDDIFLHALAGRPELFDELFLRLAQRVPGDVFARFMADAGSPADEARIVAALTDRRFLGAAVGSMVRSRATAA